MRAAAACRWRGPTLVSLFMHFCGLGAFRTCMAAEMASCETARREKSMTISPRCSRYLPLTGNSSPSAPAQAPVANDSTSTWYWYPESSRL